AELIDHVSARIASLELPGIEDGPDVEDLPFQGEEEDPDVEELSFKGVEEDRDVEELPSEREGEDDFRQPVRPMLVAVTASEVRHRNLVAKALLGYFEEGTQLPVAMLRGVIDGMWDGVNSKMGGFTELAQFIQHPIQRGSEIHHAVVALKDVDLANVGDLLNNLLDDFLTDAEKSVSWDFKYADLENEIALRGYVSGYTFAFLIEQVASTIGSFDLNQAGQVFKEIMLSSKLGRWR
ncbi:MAG: hypothetical protein M3463_17465, partial [Verrucomicrobiota bacterium]|nr:hypothetical protein [Verrucomicrobiota bacterium]